MTQEQLMEEEKEGLQASPGMQHYFDTFRKDCFEAYTIAQKARARGYDPEEEVGVALVKTLAERVIGLSSVIAPQIKNAGVEKRIEHLENKYGVLDWRVALVIAHEIAQQKFCSFEDEVEAITVGIRVGFAYITLGVVSAPLEGLTSIEIKDRLDKKGKYFCMNFSGPIRNAGGTAAAVSVLIADYVRVKMGYAEYDPTTKECQRCPAEIGDYHNYITNLQYFPSEAESLFLMEHIPIEIAGDPSEKYDVGNINLRDLPRVPTNKLRSGYCLIHSSCIPLKAPKLWKQLSKWGADFDMGHWSFLQEFLTIQKKMKAKGVETTNEKITPDYTYIKDLVAGRPVLAYPLREGGFRLRYGRSRASGYSGQAIHPCTMHILNDYIASATQLKVERPGKAAAFMPCDTIDGPIVRLKDGSVVYLEHEEDALAVKDKVAKILYLGDVLVNYGDFYDRNHSLVPVGYCPEWWAQEVAKAMESPEQLATATVIAQERITKLLNTPLKHKPTANEALLIAEKTNTPLHSAWTPFLTRITPEQLRALQHSMQKETLELLGIPHDKEGNVSSEWKTILSKFLEGDLAGEDVLTIVSKNVLVRDKAGTFIGARMGRPEKAKMRKLTGSPHALFPVGEEGGRLRSIQEALVRRKITAEYPLRFCKQCDQKTVFARCEQCDVKTEQQTQEIEWYGEKQERTSARQEIPINKIFDACLKKLNFSIYPDLIKGVRGTSNKSHIPEHLIKGILRAKHSIHVNKDGTTRYDCSEVALTHFRPREIGVPIEKLITLGYTHDCRGVPLKRDDQILELKAQDVVIPCCPDSPDEPCDAVLMRTAQFIDELLEKLYGMGKYYNITNRENLVGQYVIGLAPHTSAGMVGRIIGFSKTQGFLAHPMFHAALRRDCDGDEACFILLMDVFLNFSPKFLPETRGSTMDAPLVVTYELNPSEVDDMAFHVDRVWNYPLKMYEAAEEYKKPYDVKVELIGDVLDTEQQFEGMGFTHDTTNLNAGVLCSAYKLLPSMKEKMDGQMDLAVKIAACDTSDVARLIIEKHFLRDIKGNFRKFSQQQFRCVKCNEKFRRPPLIGRCTKCKGKILFTISEGSVVKYLEPSLELAEQYGVPPYLQQDLELLRRKIEDYFGREKEKQTGLGEFG
ncbi:MAG: DNA polymerase II large subunit [Candidatus Woesearchaeota archaeon]|nr:DNA polymerase II large subunit [Candidatus Woesearchaeota archaeon]